MLLKLQELRLSYRTHIKARVTIFLKPSAAGRDGRMLSRET